MSLPLFGPEGRDALEQFLRASPLLAFDFDGTLAPIRRDRERALMRERTQLLLALVARAYPCVVVTGRLEADVRRRLRGVPLAGIAGNHGIEDGHNGDDYAELVQRWLRGLRQELRGQQGVELEDKRLSLSIHYRNARDVRGAGRKVRRAAGQLAEARLIPGKRVVNVLPLGAPDKADAVARFARRIRCDHVIFLGDDVNDETVFSIRTLPLLGIRVGRSVRSAARFHLRDQGEVDAFLDHLLDARRATLPAL